MSAELPPLAPSPKIVFLHDRTHSNLHLPARNVGLEPPYSLWGFTDVQVGQNPYNGGLYQAVSNADVLFIQRGLLGLQTADVRLALCAVKNALSPDSVGIHTYVYDDDYAVEHWSPDVVSGLHLDSRSPQAEGVAG